MRTPLIAGNWKMHMTGTAAAELVAELLETELNTGAQVLICPPFTALAAVEEVLEDAPVHLGAQNMHWEEQGAYTGEISPAMLVDAGCEYVILGHSERRQLFGETDEGVARKAAAAFAHRLIPVICCGETEAQRDAGETAAHIRSQVTAAVRGLSAADAAQAVIAYEPIWAIGTGKTATTEQAQEVCRLIREVLAEVQNEEVAQAVRILYGGSVKPANIAALMAQPDIDGALVGGASLTATDFAGIVNYGEEA